VLFQPVQAMGKSRTKDNVQDLDSSHTRRDRASARDSTRGGKLLSQGDQDYGRGKQQSSRVHALTPIHTSSVMAAPRRAALSMMLPIFSTLESSAQTISAHTVKATIECSVGSLVHRCLVRTKNQQAIHSEMKKAQAPTSSWKRAETNKNGRVCQGKHECSRAYYSTSMFITTYFTCALKHMFPLAYQHRYTHMYANKPYLRLHKPFTYTPTPPHS